MDLRAIFGGTGRDTGGFATKFCTAEGNFDLVGNNIPVFFIPDGIKFPHIIHAGKPHPDQCRRRDFAGEPRRDRRGALRVGGRTAGDARTGARPATADHAADTQVALMVQECFRHAKAIGTWGDGSQAFTASGVEESAAGVVTGDAAGEVLSEVTGLLAEHRVWNRSGAG